MTCPASPGSIVTLTFALTSAFIVFQTGQRDMRGFLQFSIVSAADHLLPLFMFALFPQTPRLQFFLIVNCFSIDFTFSSPIAYRFWLPPLDTRLQCVRPDLPHVQHLLLSPLPPCSVPLLLFLPLPLCHELFPPRCASLPPLPRVYLCACRSLPSSSCLHQFICGQIAVRCP